ncbi:proline-rich protein 18 [Eptesicus fuscus]|uniref:proline-rich protein 18 n=1 Tax=Eptesicus fuscus TaxID=29078 RepID=UPI002404114A|nr:proline-rich protein 18 [Eptesicus fuscus]
MPFPPPPAPAPGGPAARPPPRRPGAVRKAAPARAPPAPPAAGEKPRPQAPPSRSWPSATLRRPPARRAPGPAPAPAPAPAGPVRFPLRLTPEAALPVQRRHRERPLLPPPRPLPLSPSAAARAQAAGPRGGGDPGGPGARRPAAPLLPRGPQAPHPRPDLRRALQASLLNDRHRYDDVEDEEEEAGAPDRGLVRRCTEWLRGVEAAAAARDRSALDALPHLSAL